MNKNSQSIPWWQLLLTSVVFMTVLGIAFFYRKQITAIILVPILYLLWIVDLSLQMFGQQCIWSLALVITLILSLVFSRRNEKPIKDLDRTVYARGPAIGRIKFWRRRLRINSRAINAVSYRRSDMRQLVIHALAYQENTNIQEIEEQLRNEQIRVPAEISKLLGLDNQLEKVRHAIGPIEFIRQRFDWTVGRFTSPKYLPDPQIEIIADYLENITEVDNEVRNT